MFTSDKQNLRTKNKVYRIEADEVVLNDETIFRDLNFKFKAGEWTCIMGVSGVGKTTLLKAMIGMLPIRQGALEVNGQVLTQAESFSRVAAGMGYIPQGRMIFPYLTVEENLLVALQPLKTRVNIYSGLNI